MDRARRSGFHGAGLGGGIVTGRPGVIDPLRASRDTAGVHGEKHRTFSRRETGPIWPSGAPELAEKPQGARLRANYQLGPKLAQNRTRARRRGRRPN